MSSLKTSTLSDQKSPFDYSDETFRARNQPILSGFEAKKFAGASAMLLLADVAAGLTPSNYEIAARLSTNTATAMPVEQKQNWRLEFALAIQNIIEIDVEDGTTHPSEPHLSKAYWLNNSDLLTAVSHFLENEKRPAIVANMVKLIGRLEMGGAHWRLGVFKRAISSDHVAVRDSAVDFAEQSMAAYVIHELKKHHETVGWLAEYISEVLESATKS